MQSFITSFSQMVPNVVHLSEQSSRVMATTATAANACRAGQFGISVVIPTVSNQWTVQGALRYLLVALIQSPQLSHPRSEVILNHGTEASYRARSELERLVSLRLRRPTLSNSQQEPAPSCRHRLLPKEPNGTAVDTQHLAHAQHLSAALCVVHSYGPRAELFAASRFFAAASIATNEVIITIDDDVLPYAPQLSPLLEAFACGVALESGFPRYSLSTQAPGLHGNQERFCDARGYEQKARRPGGPTHRRQHRGPLVVLTNFASFSRELARRLTARFDDWYGELIVRSRGNGEDIVFSDGVRKPATYILHPPTSLSCTTCFTLRWGPQACNLHPTSYILQHPTSYIVALPALQPTSCILHPTS